MYAYLISLQDKTYIMFISMVKRNDYETWMQLAKVHCSIPPSPLSPIYYSFFLSAFISGILMPEDIIMVSGDFG